MKSEFDIGGRQLKRSFALIVAFILLLGMAPGFMPLAADADEGIVIDMKVGFNEFYKIGYSTPVYFEIQNRLRDINGELQIELPGHGNSITLYAMKVSLPKDSVKKFTMNVPVNTFNTKLKVNLAEDRTIVATKTFRVDPGVNGDSIAIGILSDNFDNVRYINKVTLNNVGNSGTRNVRLDETSFPEDKDVLKTFNVIVINDFDTSKLGKSQYEALKKWVYDGGLLVIGTGPTYGKTLSVFKDDFLSGTTGEVTTLNTSSLGRLAESRTTETMSISALDISLKDGTAIVSEGSFPLLQRIERGRGVIGMASFDFGLEPLSAWTGNSTFADKAIAALLPKYYLGEMYQKGVAMDGNLYAINNALRNIPELPLPKTSHMVFLYAAYILLDAPVSYMVLKKLDRRELMWAVVPALSVIFSLAVYISGAGTRLTQPVTNVISLVDINNSGTISPKIYAGVFTPQKDSMRVEVEEGFDLRPFLMNNDYYGVPSGDDGSKRVVDTKVTLSPKAVMEFYRNGIWSMKTMSVETDRIYTGKLESKLNYANGLFTGAISNTSGFDLEECYIITPNQYASIGPVKNGETKQVAVKPSSYFGQRYDLINAIYKDPYSGAGNSKKKFTPDEIRQLRINNQKRQVLEYGFMNDSYTGFEARLMAWSNTPVAGKLLVNGKSVKGYEKTLITSSLDMSFRDGNRVEYPLGFLTPTIVNNQTSGSYDEYGKAFYGKGSFEVHYKLDDNINVDSIGTQYNVENLKLVKQYLWDARAGSWVEGDYRSYELKGAELDKFIDQNKVLKIRIEMEEGSVQLPMIVVKGSVK